jgi:hypothetical protein
MVVLIFVSVDQSKSDAIDRVIAWLRFPEPVRPP